MTESDVDEPDGLGALLGEMRRAYARAADVVRGMSDPHQAFEAATRLTTALRDMADAAARLRGEAITAIWTAEELSLAALAKHVGVSKSRANQLIQAAKTTQEDSDG